MARERPAVKHTQEFDRICRLPRRTPDPAEAELMAEVLTPELRAPRSKAEVRRWQAYAYFEIANAPPGRGAVLWLPVGIGKTWITYFAPRACGATRPLMILSKVLIDKTWKDFSEFRGVWQPPDMPWVIKSREWLATNPEYLCEYKPDLIVLDESDEFANLMRGAPLAIDHYWCANEHVRIVALTGTPERWSLLDFWHILRWCLRDGCPLPLTQGEARMWAAAIDERVRNPAMRPCPGPLGHNSEAARDWIRRRILETPGVVSVDEDSCDAPLVIETRLAREDPVLDTHFRDFRRTLCNPGGVPVDVPLSQYQLEGQMGVGLYSTYVKPPPEHWKLANRARAKFVREAIQRAARAGELVVTEAPILRRHEKHPVVRRWLEVRGDFTPEMRTIWLTRSTVMSALDWLRESAEPGIVWCGSVEFARELSREAALPYYGAKGTCEGGGGIIHADPKRSLIASWNANKKGLNLQAWGRQLIVYPPQSSKWLEQIFGRSHRSGRVGAVRIIVLLTSGGTVDLFETAIREAQSAKGVVGLTQKILRAEIKRARPRLTGTNKYRWANREGLYTDG